MYTENIRKEKSKNLLHKQEVTHFRGRKKFYKGLFNSSLYSDNRWSPEVECPVLNDYISFISG